MSASATQGGHNNIGRYEVVMVSLMWLADVSVVHGVGRLRRRVEVRADSSVDDVHQSGQHVAGPVQHASVVQVSRLRVEHHQAAAASERRQPATARHAASQQDILHHRTTTAAIVSRLVHWPFVGGLLSFVHRCHARLTSTYVIDACSVQYNAKWWIL